MYLARFSYLTCHNVQVLTRYLLQKLFGPGVVGLTNNENILYLDLPSNMVSLSLSLSLSPSDACAHTLWMRLWECLSKFFLALNKHLNQSLESIIVACYNSEIRTSKWCLCSGKGCVIELFYLMLGLRATRFLSFSPSTLFLSLFHSFINIWMYIFSLKTSIRRSSHSNWFMHFSRLVLSWWDGGVSFSKQTYPAFQTI